VRFSKEGPLNFGIVVHNKAHTIYRSAALGREGLADIADYLQKRNLPFPKTIIHMNKEGYRWALFTPSNFAVEEHQESLRYGFEYFHSFRYDYSTYLEGHNPYNASVNVNRSRYFEGDAKKVFGFNETYEIKGGMDSFYRILDIILQSEGPVLFHCTGGHHRTGMIAMAIRYLQGGDWREGEYEADVWGPNILVNAAKYEYFLHNKNFFRRLNLEFIDRWAQDPLFEVYRTRYQAS
jgi:hypothetical protein